MAVPIGNILMQSQGAFGAGAMTLAVPASAYATTPQTGVLTPAAQMTAPQQTGSVWAQQAPGGPLSQPKVDAWNDPKTYMALAKFVNTIGGIVGQGNPKSEALNKFATDLIGSYAQAAGYNAVQKPAGAQQGSALGSTAQQANVSGQFSFGAQPAGQPPSASSPFGLGGSPGPAAPPSNVAGQQAAPAWGEYLQFMTQEQQNQLIGNVINSLQASVQERSQALAERKQQVEEARYPGEKAFEERRVKVAEQGAVSEAVRAATGVAGLGLEAERNKINWAGVANDNRRLALAAQELKMGKIFPTGIDGVIGKQDSSGNVTWLHPLNDPNVAPFIKALNTGKLPTSYATNIYGPVNRGLAASYYNAAKENAVVRAGIENRTAEGLKKLEALFMDVSGNIDPGKVFSYLPEPMQKEFHDLQVSSGIIPNQAFGASKFGSVAAPQQAVEPNVKSEDYEQGRADILNYWRGRDMAVFTKLVTDHALLKKTVIDYLRANGKVAP